MSANDPLPGIPASHDTSCARCHQGIGKGDRIAFLRGAPIHVACVTKGVG